MSEMKTKILPVLPLGNGVLLPSMMAPVRRHRIPHERILNTG